MFETAVIRSRPARGSGRELFTLPVSIALHAMFLSVAVTVAVWNVGFPASPPRLLERFVQISPPPPPVPAPKIALGDGRDSAMPDVKVPVQPALIPTPVDVAPNLATTSSSAPGATATRAGGQGGDPQGIAGGDPAGVVNGTPGGVPGGDGVGGEPLPVTGDVKAPLVLERVSPVYPEIARRLRRKGSAIVECIIDRAGAIRDVRIVTSDFPPFGEAAAVAVRKWRFKPGTLHGQPVDTIFQLTIRFDLH